MKDILCPEGSVDDMLVRYAIDTDYARREDFHDISVTTSGPVNRQERIYSSA